ncbi:unnamed protein product [Sphagnum troendelagicum]|uniref:Uncharacterized protein n=1 Tax=Sphagnum troendelagicum TaxID=128251 RepID=A0ABP0UI53_9BRYO
MMGTLAFEDISRRWGFLMMHYVHTLLKSCNHGTFACGSSVWSSLFPTRGRKLGKHQLSETGQWLSALSPSSQRTSFSRM